MTNTLASTLTKSLPDRIPAAPGSEVAEVRGAQATRSDAPLQTSMGKTHSHVSAWSRRRAACEIVACTRDWLSGRSAEGFEESCFEMAWIRGLCLRMWVFAFSGSAWWARSGEVA